MSFTLEPDIGFLYSQIRGLRALKTRLRTTQRKFDNYVLRMPGCDDQLGKIMVERERWEELIEEKKGVGKRLAELERLIEDAERGLKELQRLQREELEASFG